MIRRWWKDFNKRDIAKRNLGIEEKKIAIQMKIDAAMSILNRREKDTDVDIERRKNGHLKLA